MILSPQLLGIPFPEFHFWQEDAIFSCLQTDKKYIILEAGTGTGKTAIYTGYIRSTNLPSLTVCATKTQQSQVSRLGHFSFFGHSHYCDLSEGMYHNCQHSNLLLEAKSEPNLVTNYANLISLFISGKINSLGTRPILILDEAHRFHDILCDHYSLDNLCCKQFGYDQDQVNSFARSYSGEDQETRRACYIINTLRRENIPVLWSFSCGLFSIKVIWASKLAKMILSYFSTVILSSATFTDLDAYLLGIESHHKIYIPSPFPASNRPFIFWDEDPPISINLKIDSIGLHHLSSRARRISESFPLSRGLIHCNSFWLGNKFSGLDRVNFVSQTDNLANELLLHEWNSLDSILMSPSIGEGLDFPDDSARFQIILKVPFLNRYTDPVIDLRCKEVPAYESNYIARTIRQIYGRINRHENDWGYTYILDSNWLKFYAKNHSLFPQDFKVAYRKESY